MNAPASSASVQPAGKPLPAAFLQALQQRFGSRMSTAQAVREHHGRDESPYAPMLPDAVVFAASTEDVAAVVGLCAQHRVPLIPFGVGTSIEGHLLAVQGGVSIDLSGMNKVLAVNAEDLTVTVQAGVTRKQLNEEIRATGFFFPIDPGADATIGGMAATRASGTNAVRYGTMRENVLGLTVVTAEGKVIRTASRARKSSAGYDLTRIFVGSEGTLGVITEVTLRVYPQPEAISAAVCSFPSVEAAVNTTIATIQLGIPIARCELLDALTVKAVNAHSKLGLAEQPMLLFEFHGSASGVKEQAEAVQEIARDHGGTGLPVGEHARGAHAAVDGAAQRLLRLPAAQAGLPQLHHRCVRADLAPGRVHRRDRDRHRSELPAGTDPRPRGRRQLPCRDPCQPRRSARGAGG
jgi:D-lactate dehydrogenase (cytochrome)